MSIKLRTFKFIHTCQTMIETTEKPHTRNGCRRFELMTSNNQIMKIHEHIKVGVVGHNHIYV